MVARWLDRSRTRCVGFCAQGRLFGFGIFRLQFPWRTLPFLRCSDFISGSSSNHRPISMTRASKKGPMAGDEQTTNFTQHLTNERSASIYTVRNYQQTLGEFVQWHTDERGGKPIWASLARDDFRGY